MKDNHMGYSDSWQPYLGDYDKFEYDIKLKSGEYIMNCYPNGGLFNVLDSNDAYEENNIAEIRFSQEPKTWLNMAVSGAKIKNTL